MNWRKLGILFVIITILVGCQTKSTPPHPTFVSTSSVINPQNFPWWNDSVFYEIFVRSFFDSDSDGIGDFRGLVSKLDYLNDANPATATDLGITGIYLMPIFPSPSYHGYDVTDYFTVNPQYGTLDDFSNFLTEAHNRGIRVIIDLPLNHTSTKHSWFQQARDPKSPYHNWYIWSDTDPGYSGPWGQQVWFPMDGRFVYAIFYDAVQQAPYPDLNYQNPAVTEEMEKIAEFWLNLGVDGFRLDAAKHLIEDGNQQQNTNATHEWLTNFRSVYKADHPQAITVGEIYGDNLSILSSYLKGDQLDLAFNFDLANSFLFSAINEEATATVNQIHYAEKLLPPHQYASFLTNHDQERLLSQLVGNMGRAKSAASLLLTAPGVPFLYYGEEIGMQGNKPDENIRRPMQWTAENNAGFTLKTPWEPLDSGFEKSNVEGESAAPDSLLNHYRTLIHLRNEFSPLRVGDLNVIHCSNPSIYAILRIYNSEAAVIIINLSNTTIKSCILSLQSSSMVAGQYQLEPLLGKASLPTLKINDKGGFSGYTMVNDIPAYETLIFQVNGIQTGKK
jgi:alpha-amylase